MRRIGIHLFEDTKLTALAREQPDVLAEVAASESLADHASEASAGVLVDLMEVLAARGVEIESAWDHEVVDLLDGEPLVYAFGTGNVEAWKEAIDALLGDETGLRTGLEALDAGASEGTPSRVGLVGSFREVLEALSKGLAQVGPGKVLAVIVP